MPFSAATGATDAARAGAADAMPIETIAATTYRARTVEFCMEASRDLRRPSRLYDAILARKPSRPLARAL
ncbi:hypothetical protein [Bradyrhizobium sp. CER78]|uniref:hypothetical protein n=1 Tax=Bradyrhizobium sp. CER78 TaxID=3039162 RepID=UPI00244A28DB|nr:hypothetical protein [Bradyrhizobium sp. CER78]MDH2384829.1 hypothetical protein [Bradyrhizobium sp. CER78]